MNFTDLFIKKPVLAIVVSALILVLGLRSATDLSVRQYPKTENAVVTISTAYYGADAQTIAGFITQPLEQAIAQAQGSTPEAVKTGIEATSTTSLVERFLRPDEIAHLAVYLASPLASATNGAALRADGGVLTAML